jgi:arabinose-5-phosphate isomerase
MKSAASGVEAVQEVKRVLSLEGRAILDCAERLAEPRNAQAVERALKLMRASLEGGGKIVVTGVGKSGKIAQKVAATLCSTGSLAVFLHPTEGLHGDLGVVVSKDVVIAYSYTGNTEELMKLQPSLKALKVPVIGIGGNAQSRLAASCEVWIDGSVSQEACPINLAPTSSTTLALALGDALAMALMRLRGFAPKDFAQNHPGGSIGNRLNLRVSDLMHQGDKVPCLGRSATMDQVVMELSQRRLGAVLIVEGEKLVGLITDGELKRALQHREKFFTMKAEQVMTPSPVTARPEMMAQEALVLMEDRPFQLSVLPVVDDQGRWKGLIRVHDLVTSL